ncbi:hypothetical protein IKF20_00680 [Candidatus Saccharibacteria bacterium]|nr:hypothetical protein [Candidatus Saccharibacteria bacterium]
MAAARTIWTPIPMGALPLTSAALATMGLAYVVLLGSGLVFRGFVSSRLSETSDKYDSTILITSEITSDKSGWLCF